MAVRPHHSSTFATLSNGQPARRLNLPTDVNTSPLLHHKRHVRANSRFAYSGAVNKTLARGRRLKEIQLSYTVA
ncbi:hypothetical protein N7494_008869 [Penicillium frequentans]|uniref:Uncharacterized protein n=1 Tax=Penicillium frequentans TaxID=3151616 RepID=A0AAD6CNR8_9EURO|nr:hypothetical protein N7494_008869 [Penicillium glabrum]